MATAVIETAGLTKYYGGIRGIEDVELRVDRGEVFGYLGPNGAGKTTTIRLLLDLIRPTRGSATIAGFDTHSQSPAPRGSSAATCSSKTAYRLWLRPSSGRPASRQSSLPPA